MRAKTLPRREVVNVTDEIERDCHAKVNCRECGRVIYLYANGGELDMARCCGWVYYLETPRINLITERV